MTSVIAWCTKAAASCFFLSYGPNAWRRHAPRQWRGSGLIGALAGVFTAPWLPTSTGPLLAALAGGLAISIAVSDYAEKLMGEKDDPRIVIDEWIGTWFAVAFCPPHLAVWIVGGILFRIFDVWKPAPTKFFSDLPGGWGVVLDDVLAGMYANAVLHVVMWIHPL